MPTYLSNFEIIRPRFELEQERSLNWIAETHARAEAAHTGKTDPSFHQELKERLFRIGFGKDKIHSRGIQVEDFFLDDWSKMTTYPVDSAPSGSGFAQRSCVFDREASHILEQFLSRGIPFPATISSM